MSINISLPELSRLQRMTVLNPGMKMVGVEDSELAKVIFRKSMLKIYDNYLTNVQYDHLPGWNDKLKNVIEGGDYRTCQPKYILPIPQIAASLFTSHITTEEARLTFKHENPNLQEDIDDFIEDLDLWGMLTTCLPSFFTNGSMFLRFFRTNENKIILEYYNTMYVHPVFDEHSQELKSVKIRYIYDTEETDPSTNEPMFNWYQLEINEREEILYQEQKFDKQEMKAPEMEVAEVRPHGLNFMPAVWVKTSYSVRSNDGDSFMDNTLDMLDDLNYMSSKLSSSVLYNLFPWLYFSGFNAEEIKRQIGETQALTGQLGIRGAKVLSTTRPPQQSNVNFLESNLNVGGLSIEYLNKILQMIQYSMSIVLLDPERIAAHAQSGRAMEALFKPVVQFVRNKRSFIKRGVCKLLDKVELASNEWGCPISLPEGTLSNSKKQWGNIFADTIQDIGQRVAYTAQGMQTGIVSKETAIKHIAQDFNVTNVTEEINKADIDEQKQLDNQLNVQ